MLLQIRSNTRGSFWEELRRWNSVVKSQWSWTLMQLGICRMEATIDLYVVSVIELIALLVD
jgi:hypothetical protein